MAVTTFILLIWLGLFFPVLAQTIFLCPEIACDVRRVRHLKYAEAVVFLNPLWSKSTSAMAKYYFQPFKWRYYIFPLILFIFYIYLLQSVKMSLFRTYCFQCCLIKKYEKVLTRETCENHKPVYGSWILYTKYFLRQSLSCCSYLRCCSRSYRRSCTNMTHFSQAKPAKAWIMTKIN